jgi:hypothetical protein
MSPSNPKKSQLFDRGWIEKRCPICREKGFSGDAAGLLYTLGEVVMGEWRFRRVGYPCGHSVEIISWPGRPEHPLDSRRTRIFRGGLSKNFGKR